MSTLNIDVSVEVDPNKNDGYPSEVVISIDEDRRIYVEKDVDAYTNGYEDGLVRCRDCKYYSDHEWILITDVSDVCNFWHGEPTKVEPEGFCKWGERRDA